MSGISVVIPTYNCERFIGQAIDSALGQTLPPDEIIVVDDGSTDKTEAVVRAYADGVRYIKKPNSGYPSITRNVGIEAAASDYIAFLDADDVWRPAKLAEQMDVFSRDPNVAMVYCDREPIDEAGELLTEVHLAQPCTIERGRIVETDEYWPDVLCQVFLQCFIQTSTVIVRKPVLDAVGRFDSDLLFVEEADLWMRIAHSHRVERLPAVLSSYRVLSSSLSATRRERMLQDVTTLCAKTRKLVADDPKRSRFVRQATRLVMASALVTTAYAPSGMSRFRRFALLCRAMMYDPLMLETQQHVWKNAVRCALGLRVPAAGGSS